MGNELKCSKAVNDHHNNSTEGGGGGGIDAETWEIWVGMGATLISSLAVALGTIIQKLAHNNQKQRDDELKSKECGGMILSPLWLLGLFLMVFFQIPLSFAALTLTSTTIVIPLGAGSTIVFNQILARCILKEILTRLEIFATIIILIGVVISTSIGSTSGGGASKDRTACELIQRYSDPGFFVPMILLLSFVVICIGLIHGWKRGKHPLFVESSLPAIYAFTAGGIGAIMNVMMKATGEFAEAALTGEDLEMWNTIHPYYHVIIVLIFACLMISYINQGLDLYEAIIFLPLYNCIFIILTVIMGSLFFREFEAYLPWQIGVMLIGILITIFGIALLSTTWARLHHLGRGCCCLCNKVAFVVEDEHLDQMDDDPISPTSNLELTDMNSLQGQAQEQLGVVQSPPTKRKLSIQISNVDSTALRDQM